MYLKIDNYTDFELNINRVHRKTKKPDDKWCEVSLKIVNKHFKYRKIKNDIGNRKKKLPKCPNCNNNLVNILYGFPIGETFKQAERKELYLGGCVKIGRLRQPIYHCYTCNRSYFEDLKEYIKTKKTEEISDTEE